MYLHAANLVIQHISKMLGNLLNYYKVALGQSILLTLKLHNHICLAENTVINVLYISVTCMLILLVHEKKNQLGNIIQYFLNRNHQYLKPLIDNPKISLRQ